MQDDSIRGGSFSFYPSPVHFLGLGFLSRPNAELAKQASSQYESAYSTAAKASESDADRKSQTAENEARIGAENTRTANTIAGENARQQQRLAEERRTKGFEMMGDTLKETRTPLQDILQKPDVYGAQGVTTAQTQLSSLDTNQFGLVGQYMNGAQAPQLSDPGFLGQQPIAPTQDYQNKESNLALESKYNALGSKTRYQEDQVKLGRIQQGLPLTPSKKGDPGIGFVGAGMTPELPEDVVNLHSALGALKTAPQLTPSDTAHLSHAKKEEVAQKIGKPSADAMTNVGKSYPFVVDGILNNRPGYQGSTPDAAPARALAAISANLGLQPQDVKNPANRDRIVQQARSFISQYGSDPRFAQTPEMQSYQALHDYLGGSITPTIGGQTQ